jgi:hypothetical protein
MATAMRPMPPSLWFGRMPTPRGAEEIVGESSVPEAASPTGRHPVDP